MEGPQGVREHPPATLLHKTGNVPAFRSPGPNKHSIWMAETREDAYRAFDEWKFPKATACLAKDREALLGFSGPTFATVVTDGQDSRLFVQDWSSVPQRREKMAPVTGLSPPGSSH